MPKLLPPEVVKAVAAYGKASVAYNESWTVNASVAYNEARAVYNKEWAACGPKINALLARLIPDCPWNGYRIVFP